MALGIILTRLKRGWCTSRCARVIVSTLFFLVINTRRKKERIYNESKHTLVVDTSRCIQSARTETHKRPNMWNEQANPLVYYLFSLSLCLYFVSVYMHLRESCVCVFLCSFRHSFSPPSALFPFTPYLLWRCDPCRPLLQLALTIRRPTHKNIQR